MEALLEYFGDEGIRTDVEARDKKYTALEKREDVWALSQTLLDAWDMDWTMDFELDLKVCVSPRTEV